MRPCEIGLDFFLHTTGMFKDIKIRLVGGEFGPLKSYGLYNLLLETIYSDKGYYMVWDEDAVLLLVRDTSEKPNYLRECVRGFVRRGLFDKRVFDEFHVLTSRGIQQRYVKAGCKRTKISIDKALLLIDPDNTDDVPAGVRGKICLDDSFRRENRRFLDRNPGYRREKPDIENIESKSISKEREDKPPGRFAAPARSDVRSYCQERNNGINPDRFFDYYEANGWKVGRNPMKDWKAAVRAWEKNGIDKKGDQPPPSYDLEGIMRSAMDFDPTKTKRGEV